MSALRKIQQSFQNSLCKRDDSIISYIVKPKNTEASDRLQVYYNDYYFRLYDALKEDYKTLYGLIGEIQFDALVKIYLEEYPSTSYTIREVGYRFPDFLSRHTEKKSHIEMAQFESAILKSLFSLDAVVLNMQALAEIDPEAWGNLQLQLHPSFRKLTCKYNTLDLWLALDTDIDTTVLNSIQLDEPVLNILWRYQNEIFFRTLTSEETVLLNGIEQGHVFSALCEKMLNYFDEEQVIEWVAGVLQTWINDGIFSQNS